jgi:hypothetical protein
VSGNAPVRAVTADRTVEVEETVRLGWSAKHTNVVTLDMALCDTEPDLALEPYP